MYAASASAPLAVVPSPLVKILVVDDHPINIRILKQQLLKLFPNQIEITIAINGDDAVNKVRNKKAENIKFDLIVMDMQMPVTDGVTATRLIKGLSPETPVLAYTSMNAAELAVLRKNENFVAVVGKPQESKKLEAIILEHTRALRSDFKPEEKHAPQKTKQAKEQPLAVTSFSSSSSSAQGQGQAKGEPPLSCDRKRLKTSVTIASAPTKKDEPLSTVTSPSSSAASSLSPSSSVSAASTPPITPKPATVVINPISASAAAEQEQTKNDGLPQLEEVDTSPRTLVSAPVVKELKSRHIPPFWTDPLSNRSLRTCATEAAKANTSSQQHIATHSYG